MLNIYYCIAFCCTTLYCSMSTAEHDSIRNVHVHLDRVSEANKMAAAARSNEADSEVLSGFSNILNKIGKTISMGLKWCTIESVVRFRRLLWYLFCN